MRCQCVTLPACCGASARSCPRPAGVPGSSVRDVGSAGAKSSGRAVGHVNLGRRRLIVRPLLVVRFCDRPPFFPVLMPRPPYPRRYLRESPHTMRRKPTRSARWPRGQQETEWRSSFYLPGESSFECVLGFLVEDGVADSTGTYRACFGEAEDRVGERGSFGFRAGADDATQLVPFGA